MKILKKILKKHSKKIIIISISILFVIILPLVIEQIIKQDKIWFVKIRTMFSKEMWFVFWGSYLGALGTIFLGTIALIQNNRLSKANEDLRKMQKDYFETLTMPNITFTTAISNYMTEGYLKEKCYVEKMPSSSFPLILKHSQYDDKNYINKIFMRLILYYENVSTVPIKKFKVKSIKWTIFNNLFEFINLHDEYRNSNNSINGSLLSLVLIVPKDTNEEYLNYQDASLNPNDINSMMDIDFCLMNQFGKQKEYSMELIIERLDMKGKFIILSCNTTTKEDDKDIIS